jgi:hypothetical protein
MAVVTTYVCDVSGKSGTERKDFVDVQISATHHIPSPHYASGHVTSSVNVKKLIHKYVAAKLNLLLPQEQEKSEAPEVSLEGKLKALLKDYVAELVEEHMEER